VTWTVSLVDGRFVLGGSLSELGPLAPTDAEECYYDQASMIAPMRALLLGL
jgi:hypothetical protein